MTVCYYYRMLIRHLNEYYGWVSERLEDSVVDAEDWLVQDMLAIRLDSVRLQVIWAQTQLDFFEAMGPSYPLHQ